MPDDPPAARQSAGTSPSLLAYLRLFRLPNVFTALADVMMGFLYVQQTLQPGLKFGLLAAASASLYTAGMVLNDLFDLPVDRHERPQRPLPSGAISLRQAQVWGGGLLLLGIVLAWLASLRSGMIGTTLAAAIVLYDGVLKKTVVAPFLMGSCRLLNVLLGMSFATAEFPTTDQLLVAAGIGIYIVGVTWFARAEARTSQRSLLLLGLAIMGCGWGLLGIFPRFRAAPLLLLHGSTVWPLLVALVALSVVRRCVAAILDPRPATVQRAVKLCILTLITLDAAVTLVTSGPVWAMVVLSLLVPTLVIGRWIYST